MTAISSLAPFAFGTTHAGHSTNDASGHEYALVRRQGATTPEVDRDDAEVLEVTVRWGRTVLGVAHLTQGQSLRIGESDGGKIMVPESFLGASTYTLIDRGTVMVPEHASDATAKGAQTVAKDQKLRFTLVRTGDVADSSEGANDSAITVQVTRVAAAKKLLSTRNLKKGIFAIGLASFVAHAGVMTALAFSPGTSLDDDTSPLDKETSAQMISLYKNADMREMPQQEETAAVTKGDAGGENGQAHSGPGGQMGSLAAKANGGAYTVKGPAETKDEHLAKVSAMIANGDYGALGAMRSVFGSVGAPTDLASSFDSELGHDADNHQGNLMGDHAGDSFGYNGLGMTGTSWGGDGFGTGIGLGPIGGLGHGPGDGGFNWGTCSGANCGMNVGSTLANKKHDPKPPTLIETDTSVLGGYPMEVVRRIVRANFPRIRSCYEIGLKSDPGLRGNVRTQFIIDQTGAVETASLVSSSLSSPAVAGCVVSVFNTMSFPAPESGKARVTYPIDFDHAE